MDVGHSIRMTQTKAYPAWAQSTLYDQAMLDALYRVAFRFVMASLVYLGIGVSLGGLLFLGVRVPIFVHVHLTLYGFLLLFIFGVAYKLVPPMFARQQRLFSLRLAKLQFWLANAGLVGLVGASALGLEGTPVGILAMVLAVAAVWIFILNMGLTLAGSQRPMSPPDAGRRPAPGQQRAGAGSREDILREEENVSTKNIVMLDVRPLPPAQKHPRLGEALASLQPGEALVLVNDEDPQPLYDRFQAERPGQFAWRSVDRGPTVWRVEIRKVAAGGPGQGKAVRATEALKAEHRTIERVLALLEARIHRLEAGEPVEVAALEKAVEFLRLFADQCHHGKEERLLFPALEQHGLPPTGGPLGVMLGEHEEGRRCLRALQEGLLRLPGDPGARRQVGESARAYIQLLRQHIGKEDTVLFVMADELLSAEEQAALTKGFDRYEHEVIGPGTHERALKLLAELEGTPG